MPDLHRNPGGFWPGSGWPVWDSGSWSIAAGNGLNSVAGFSALIAEQLADRQDRQRSFGCNTYLAKRCISLMGQVIVLLFAPVDVGFEQSCPQFEMHIGEVFD